MFTWDDWVVFIMFVLLHGGVIGFTTRYLNLYLVVTKIFHAWLFHIVGLIPTDKMNACRFDCGIVPFTVNCVFARLTNLVLII